MHVFIYFHLLEMHIISHHKVVASWVKGKIGSIWGNLEISVRMQTHSHCKEALSHKSKQKAIESNWRDRRVTDGTDPTRPASELASKQIYTDWMERKKFQEKNSTPHMRWMNEILKTNPLIKHSLRQKKEASEMDESMLSADKTQREKSKF